ncbi:hypothetical protein Tco_0970938 [Tanacetum coccineum]
MRTIGICPRHMGQVLKVVVSDQSGQSGSEVAGESVHKGKIVFTFWIIFQASGPNGNGKWSLRVESLSFQLSMLIIITVTYHKWSGRIFTEEFNLLGTFNFQTDQYEAVNHGGFVSSCARNSSFSSLGKITSSKESKRRCAKKFDHKGESFSAQLEESRIGHRVYGKEERSNFHETSRRCRGVWDVEIVDALHTEDEMLVVEELVLTLDQLALLRVIDRTWDFVLDDFWLLEAFFIRKVPPAADFNES